VDNNYQSRYLLTMNTVMRTFIINEPARETRQWTFIRYGLPFVNSTHPSTFPSKEPSEFDMENDTRDGEFFDTFGNVEDC